MAEKNKKQAIPTEREIRWMQMLSDGVKSKDIAKKEKINGNTFAYLLKELRVRFGCNNSLHLVAKFLRDKVIS